MELKGKINEVSEVQSGTSKAGKEWQKLTFAIDTGTDYDNLIAFTIFGTERVEKFTKYNKVGDAVIVAFNIKSRKFGQNWYTDLDAWMIKKDDGTATPLLEDTNDNLPF